MMSKGWTMKGGKEQITLTLGDKRLKFRLFEKILYYFKGNFLETEDCSAADSEWKHNNPTRG